jgi:hypothetical protein
MGRVNLNDLDKYNSGGGNKISYFRLQDDGDVERVRILIADEDDLNNYIYNTHKVKVGENAKYPNRHINCLRAYNDPITDCPLCESKASVSVRVFIPVYNINAEEIQFFERPKAYIGKLQKLLRRYDNFPSHIFEIERNGAKGDQQTTYDIIEVDEDDTTLEDLPEVPDILGSVVYDATIDDMEYYLDTGELPPSGGNNDDDDEEEPVRRRTSKKSKRQEDDEPPFDEDEEERPRARRRNTETRRGGRSVHAEEKRSRRRSDEDEF